MPDASPNDTELEKLLAQLLRMISPGLSTAEGGRAADRGAGRAGGPRRGSEQAGGPRLNGRAHPSGQAATEAEPGDLADAVMAPDMSASEARALIELVSARGIAQGELASLLGLDKSTVSRLAAGLERKGWIRRGRDEDNQRYVRLYLTPAGREVGSRLWRAWHSRQERILARLSADERAGLAAGLGGLVRGLAAEGLLTEPEAQSS